METDLAVDRLAALAHSGRLGAFRMLVQAGAVGVAAGELSRRLDIVPSTLSAHLNVLNHAGLIDPRRDGRSIIYTANYDGMSALLAFLMEDCCAGSGAICGPLAEIATRAACCDAEPASA